MINSGYELQEYYTIFTVRQGARVFKLISNLKVCLEPYHSLHVKHICWLYRI